MFSNLRGWEWLILLLIVLLLFGARRLPELARSVGKSAKIFRSEVKDLRDDDGADDHRDAGAATSTAALPAVTPVDPTLAGTTPTGAAPPMDATTTANVHGASAGTATDDDGERRRS